MIIRVVKMTFREEAIPEFMEIFNNSKARIRAFEGCNYLELLKDQSAPRILFTYSYWEDQASLERYRQSDLFKETWADTKKLFAAKPEAWSLETIDKLD